MFKSVKMIIRKLALVSAFSVVLALPLHAAEVDVQLSLDRSMLPAESEGTGYLKIALIPALIKHAESRPPLNIAIVLDRSGSMGGQKIADAKAGVIEAMNHISSNDRLSFIVYDNDVQTVFSGATLNSTTYAWHRQQVKHINSGGSTAIYAALQRARDVLREHQRGGWVNRVILLSDGLANVGPDDPASFRRLGAQLAEQGLMVSTIGLGLNFNEDLMTGLAQSGDGNAFFVESSHDLPYIFEQEMGQAVNVAATDVVMHIELPEGLRPVRTIGRHGEVDGQTVRIDIKQLYGGQEKFALVEFAHDAQAEDALHKIKATIDYQDTQADQARQLTQATQVGFSKDEQTVLASVDKDVAEAVALNRMAEAREQAIALSDKGENRAAAVVLQDTNAMVLNYFEVNEMPAPASVGEQVSLMYQDSALLERQPYDNAKRKQASFDSFSTRNQQSVASKPGDEQNDSQ